MVRESNSDTTFTSQQSAGLHGVVARFEDACRAGAAPEIDAFLPADGSIRRRALIELICIDLEHRCQDGQSPRVEDYLQRYPELDDQEALRQLVAAECRARRLDSSAAMSDYQCRFPQLKEEPAGWLDATQLTLPSALPRSSAATSGTADLDPRYRILQPHARGGIGQVFIALDNELHRHVALKEIQAEHATDPLNRNRFLLEAEITGNLEHPGIVPVYGLGCYADGRPFYAMRFIKGDNLKEAIKSYHQEDSVERRRLLLRQLLSRFIAVCNAVAYAHSRGAIHRDLKPGNIMLGKYGETLVVDWGLAKVVGRTEPAPPDESSLRVRHSGDSETLATQFGQTMGTPAYMSPEQTLGRPDLVGPASDIYSLGATLYHLLAGQPPFQEKDLSRLLAQVRKGEFPPPRQPGGTTSKPLEAICLKAMALKPEDRYPSALALAADIEHWLGDQPVSAHRETVVARLGRWLRRHRAFAASAAAILAVAAVALSISTLLIGLEKAETDKARAQAEHNFREAQKQRLLAEANLKDAEAARKRAQKSFLDAERERKRAEAEADEVRRQKKLADDNAARALALRELAEKHGELARANFQRARDAVDQMLAEADRNLPPGAQRQHLRRKILEKALAFYQGFLKEKGDDLEIRKNAGDAYLRLADIYQRLDEEKKAHEHYESAVALFEGLLQDVAGGIDISKLLAVCHNNRGTLYSRQGNDAAAIASYRDSLAIQEKLVKDAPDQPALQAELANTLLNLGSRLASTGKQQEAKLQRSRAFAIIGKLAKDHPERLDWQHALANVYIILGQTLEAERKTQPAYDAFFQAQEILKRLIKIRPAQPEVRRDLATSYHGLGVQLANMKKGKDAYEAYQKALDLRGKLVGEFPSDPVFRTDLGASHHILGLRLSRMDRKPEAEKSFRQALEVRGKLAGEFPARLVHQRNLAETLVELAQLLESIGLKTAALDSFREALTPLAAAKHHVLLARTANHLPRLAPASWQDHFEAARCLAQCAAFADADDRLPADRRTAFARSYCDQAVRLLQQAVEKGLSNAALLSDARFNVLRSRDDFKAVVERLSRRK